MKPEIGKKYWFIEMTENHIKIYWTWWEDKYYDKFLFALGNFSFTRKGIEEKLRRIKKVLRKQL